VLVVSASHQVRSGFVHADYYPDCDCVRQTAKKSPGRKNPMQIFELDAGPEATFSSQGDKANPPPHAKSPRATGI
jgi:hypothetical protein